MCARIYVHMHVYTMSLLAIGCISKEFIYMQEIPHPTITSDKKKKKIDISCRFTFPFILPLLKACPRAAKLGSEAGAVGFC